MHIGQRIKKIRKGRNLTQKELAHILDVEASAVSAWELGRNKPLLDKLSIMSTYFNVPLSKLIEDEHSQDENNCEDFNENNIRMIGVYGDIQAGEPNLAHETIEAYMPTLNSMLDSNKDYFYLKVVGDSMNKEFSNGSLILVEKTANIENGKIGVILVNGYDATVKKINVIDNKITLIPLSTDPFYKDRTYDIEKDNVLIMGKVIQAIKIYS